MFKLFIMVVTFLEMCGSSTIDKNISEELPENTNRTKRSVIKAESFDRSSEASCRAQLNTTAGSQKEGRQVIFANVGDQVILGCPICDENIRYSKWYKVAKKHAIEKSVSYVNLYQHAEELDIDTDRSASLNGLHLNENFELVIQSVTDSDAGQYFCQQYIHNTQELYQQVQASCFPSTNAQNCREKLRELELSLSRRPLSSTSLNGFTLIYLLEVYLPSPVTLKVSTYGGAIQPHQTELSDYNLVGYSQWASWSLCNSSCNAPGYRRRHGRCYVRSLENKQPRPQILRDVIAISGQRLLPCHSTLFQFANPVFSLPEEEEISRCVRECRLEASTLPSTTETFEVFGATTESILTKHTLYPKVGARLVLRCYGAQLNRTVRWFNGTKLILVDVFDEDETGNAEDKATSNQTATNTSRRVEISKTGELIIDPVTNYDNQRFACWVARKNTVAYVLDIDGIKTIEYGQYLLYAKYMLIFQGVFFLIFCIYLIIQHIWFKRHQPQGDEEREGEEYYAVDYEKYGYYTDDYYAQDYYYNGNYYDYTDGQYEGDNYYNTDYSYSYDDSAAEERKKKLTAPSRQIPTLLRYERLVLGEKNSNSTKLSETPQKTKLKIKSKAKKS